jgi:hypothetical protein
MEDNLGAGRGYRSPLSLLLAPSSALVAEKTPARNNKRRVRCP